MTTTITVVKGTEDFFLNERFFVCDEVLKFFPIKNTQRGELFEFKMSLEKFKGAKCVEIIKGNAPEVYFWINTESHESEILYNLFEREIENLGPKEEQFWLYFHLSRLTTTIS